MDLYHCKNPLLSCRQKWVLYGAGNEARTRYLHLGKVALYRMSYARTRNIINCTTLFIFVKYKFSVP